MPQEPQEEQQRRWSLQQEELARQVQLPEVDGYQPTQGDILLGLDIQYEGDTAYVAGDLSYWGGKHIGVYAGTFAITAPYISGFFCFREGPPLLALLAALLREGHPRPQMIVVDGHGLAHPRRFGAACWVGIATGIPTLGCAKDTLLHFDGELGLVRGSVVPVMLGQEQVGVVLRRIDEVRPVYVSPGHLLDLETARQIILEVPGKYRIPDPIRRADRAARALSKGQRDKGWHPLGQLPPALAPWE